MLYKGDTPVKCYKSLGNVTVKNYDGTQTLETIPWYSEQKAYQGETGSLYQTKNLIYPCFDITKKDSHDQSSYHAIPATNMDALNSYYSAASANSVPSNIQLFNNIENYKFGYFKNGSSAAVLGDYTQNFSCSSEEAPSGTLYLGFSTTSQLGGDGMKIVPFGPATDNVAAIDTAGINDIAVLREAAESHDVDTVNVFYSATLLTSVYISQIDLDVFIAPSPYDSADLPKSGPDSESLWTSALATPSDVAMVTNPIAGFDNLRLWHISVGANFTIFNDALATHIAPRFKFYNSSSSYHIMAANLFASLYMSKQGV